MTYNINDKVSISIEEKFEHLDETFRKKNKDGIEIIANKRRHYKIYSYLMINNTLVLKDNIFDIIFFIEILKGFANNKLDVDKTYFIHDKLECNISRKDGKMYLQINFFKLDNYLYYDKIEANIFASQINKVISKCEAKPE